MWPRQLARGALTVVLLAASAWLCLEAAPGSPAEAAARAAGLLPADPGLAPSVRREIVAASAARLGLDRPAPVRFARALGGLVQGDLGRSWRDGRPVTEHLARALPETLGLMAAALLVAYALGLAGALAAARRPGGRLDGVVAAGASLAIAVPPAWAAIVAARALAGGHPFAWLPPGGGGSAAAYVLPVACLAYVAAAVVARHGRAALLEAGRQPFLLACRARGASPARALVVHALSAAAASLAGLLGGLVPYLLGACVVVERAFDLRGLGALLVDAAAAGDAPVVLGAVVVAGALCVLGSVAGDLAARSVNPRLGEERP